MVTMKNPAASCRVSACKQAAHSVIARTLSILSSELVEESKDEGDEAISKRRVRFAFARDDSVNPVANYRELSSYAGIWGFS